MYSANPTRSIRFDCLLFDMWGMGTTTSPTLDLLCSLVIHESQIAGIAVRIYLWRNYILCHILKAGRGNLITYPSPAHILGK
jgi:hypothetical protein